MSNQGAMTMDSKTVDLGDFDAHGYAFTVRLVPWAMHAPRVLGINWAVFPQISSTEGGGRLFQLAGGCGGETSRDLDGAECVINGTVAFDGETRIAMDFSVYSVGEMAELFEAITEARRLAAEMLGSEWDGEHRA